MARLRVVQPGSMAVAGDHRDTALQAGLHYCLKQQSVTQLHAAPTACVPVTHCKGRLMTLSTPQ
jgi:hypothetical protein